MKTISMFTAAFAATVAGHAGAQASAEPSQAQPASVVAWDPACAPKYPQAAVLAGVQGTTRVAVHLDAAGKVVSVDVVQSAGEKREHRMLDHETVRAVALCPFTPARDASGKPVASVVTMSQEWHLAPAADGATR